MSDDKNKKKPYAKPAQNSLAELIQQADIRSKDRKHVQNEERINVISLVATIDDNIIKMLEKTLTPSLDERNDDLLKEGGIIGTLGLRAKLCVRLGLISPSLYTLIKDLSKIRNNCSHKPQNFDVFNDDFSISKINYHWDRMNPELFKEDIKDTSKRFEELCSYINTLLVLNTRNIKSRVFRDNELLFRR